MKKQYFTKRILPMTLAAVLALSPLQVMAAGNDLSGHWAEKVIAQWQDTGLIKGYADGSFKPDHNVTRAEFVIMMNNALGFTDTEDITFGDVKAGDWYYDAVAKAVAAGYSRGYTDGTFKPGAAITRAEAAVMIANAAGLEADETSAEGFTDTYAIPAWAKGSIGAVVNAGFMSGYTDGSFGAARSITRAKAVSLLNGVMGGVAAAEEAVTEDITVTEDDTVVENSVINGDLIIDEAVGDGEVYLNDLIVEGDIIVNGGGNDSIYFKNVTVKGKIKVNKKGVRLHLMGDTKIPYMEVTEISQITSESFEGEVGTIAITGELGTGQRVILNVPAEAVVVDGKANISIASDVATVEISEAAEGAKVEVAKDATVGTMVADAKVNIVGTGKVENLEANADGITVNKNLSVDNTETAAGVSKPATGGSASNGGSGSSSGGASNRPSIPDTPENPDTPEEPEVPEQPDTPPVTPDVPETPEQPDTPSTPTAVTKADVEALMNRAIELDHTAQGTSEDGKDLPHGTVWVTPDMRNALAGAMNEARNVLGITEAKEPTAEELNAAKTALETAMAGFQSKTADLTAAKEALASAIAVAQERYDAVTESADGTNVAVESEWATAAAKDGLANAITAAGKIKDTPEVTENNLTITMGELEAALAGFNKQVAYGKLGAKEITGLAKALTAVTVDTNKELLTAEEVVAAYPEHFPDTLTFYVTDAGDDTATAAEGEAETVTVEGVTWTCTDYDPLHVTTAQEFTADYKLPQGYMDDTDKVSVTNTVTLTKEQKAAVTEVTAVTVTEPFVVEAHTATDDEGNVFTDYRIVTATVTGTKLGTGVKVALGTADAVTSEEETAVLPAESTTTAEVELSTEDLKAGTYYVWYTINGTDWTKVETAEVEVRPFAGSIAGTYLNPYRDLTDIKVKTDDDVTTVEEWIQAAVEDILAGTAFEEFDVAVQTNGKDGSYQAPTETEAGFWMGKITISDPAEEASTEDFTFENRIVFRFAEEDTAATYAKIQIVLDTEQG